MLRAFVAVLIGWFSVQGALAAGFDHGEWDQLLSQHVMAVRNGHATAVDYQGMARDRGRLTGYLQSLARVGQPEFDRWPQAQQLAFLINAYNAGTVELVLTAYPGIQSIKELGGLFGSPWKKAFIPLLGRTRSLDDVEHGLIRGSGRYQEPRIHFAVNCASIGCPALRREAYTGRQLDQQLTEQTRMFLSDNESNRLEGGRLKVSSIFKWYRKDFEQGWRGYRSLPGFFAQWADALGLTETDIRRLRSGEMGIDYLDYDWGLNAQAGGR